MTTFPYVQAKAKDFIVKKKRRKTENLSENSRQYEENKTKAHFQVIDPMNNVHISHLLSLAFGLQRIKQHDLCLN